MAIAYDTVSEGGGVGASPKQWDHTCASGSSLLVMAYIVAATDTTTGCTYNGVAMTKVATYARIDDYSWAAFYLQNPATGTNQISLSASSGSISGRGLSFTGVAGGVDVTSVTNGGTTPTTLTIVTVADNAWIVATGQSDGANPVASTNWTQAGTVTGATIAGYRGPVSPPGSYGMTFTHATGNGNGFQVSLSPTAAAAGPANLKTYNTNVKANIKTMNTNVLANVKTFDTNV